MECTYTVRLWHFLSLFKADMKSNRICFLNYREDGVTPYMIIWKHALIEMKV